jgi:anti-anti-sigma factor
LPSLPLYAFDAAASGVVSIVRRPRIAGAAGRTFLHCWEEAVPEATVLHVEGEVDVATAPLLAKAIAGAFSRNGRLIVHLGRVRYLDGSAIHVLEDASRADGGRMVVIGSAPHVHRLFDILRLTDVLPVVPDLEAARAYLRG